MVWTLLHIDDTVIVRMGVGVEGVHELVLTEFKEVLWLGLVPQQIIFSNIMIT